MADLYSIVSLFLVSVAAALTGLGLLVVLPRRADDRLMPLLDAATSDTIFLFDGETLVDASPTARALIAGSSLRGPPWQRLMAFLVRHFPDIETRLTALPDEGRLVLESGQGGALTPLALVAELRSGLVQIRLTDPDADRSAVVDPLTLRATGEELELLRSTVGLTPHPVWVQNGAQEVIWSNGSYLKLAVQSGEELSWPLPRVFRLASQRLQRIRIVPPGKAPMWFEVVTAPFADGVMAFAQPIDALVQAEGTLREFTQTLTKTFASLPIGLAIFDRQRKLALFNPALADLTTLAPEFLIGNPTLFDFLNQLRDRQMIPEPKDFSNWRKRLTDLEKASAIGQFEEHWNLPGGQTFRVIGRPHPEGALALLFEDVTLQISQTRRDRANVELGQAIVDSVSDAVAVFGQGGDLVLANAAYTAMWNHDPMEVFQGGCHDIGELASYWRNLSSSTPAWAEIEAVVRGAAVAPAAGWPIRLQDGRALLCRVVSLTGGATMVEFSAFPQAELSPVEDFGTPLPFVSQRRTGLG